MAEVRTWRCSCEYVRDPSACVSCNVLNPAPLRQRCVHGVYCSTKPGQGCGYLSCVCADYPWPWHLVAAVLGLQLGMYCTPQFEYCTDWKDVNATKVHAGAPFMSSRLTAVAAVVQRFWVLISEQGTAEFSNLWLLLTMRPYGCHWGGDSIGNATAAVGFEQNSTVQVTVWGT